MKMKRFTAKDMRQALSLVRAEQGPDAVILSTRRVTDGVEVCAAVDFDFSEPLAAVDRGAAGSTPADDASLYALERSHAEGVGDEIRNLRRLLETQVAALAWNDYTRREPMKAKVLAELTNVGVSRDLALEIVAALPEALDAEQASRLPFALLARRINTTSGVALERGGILALVGPNGVGKTTTLAKLATRWVIERGPNEIALVSTDRDRFGSHEQLQALGRLLGVPTYFADGGDALDRLLDRLADRRVVLIDAPGLNPRSDRLQRELGALAGLRPDIEIGLVLAASAQAGTIEEAVERYALLRPSYCLLTKVDEAASLGGALSALARSGLPLAWISHGSRVPEDLERARAAHLVARAVNLARRTGAASDEDLLARRFGGKINAAA